MTQFERRAFSNGAKVERDRGKVFVVVAIEPSRASPHSRSRRRRRGRRRRRVCRSFTLALSPTTTATDILPLLSYIVRAFLSLRRLIVSRTLFSSQRIIVLISTRNRSPFIFFFPLSFFSYLLLFISSFAEERERERGIKIAREVGKRGKLSS